MSLKGGTFPNDQDWIITTSGLGFAVGLETFGKDHLTSVTPKWTQPLPLDLHARSRLWWGLDRQDVARNWSDRLIYGVSLSSLAWGPLLAENSEQAFFINASVFSANSIVTNLIKIVSSRERPYAHFQSRPPQGPRDNTSFISGHASVAFSQALSNAMILSQRYPDQDRLIWTSLLGSAGLTAYLRVAGDMHYISDILAGSVVGILIGWTLTNHFLNEGAEQEAGEGAALRGVSPHPASNMLFMIKIPLG